MDLGRVPPSGLQHGHASAGRVGSYPRDAYDIAEMGVVASVGAPRTAAGGFQAPSWWLDAELS